MLSRLCIRRLHVASCPLVPVRDVIWQLLLRYLRPPSHEPALRLARVFPRLRAACRRLRHPLEAPQPYPFFFIRMAIIIRMTPTPIKAIYKGLISSSLLWPDVRSFAASPFSLTDRGRIYRRGSAIVNNQREFFSRDLALTGRRPAISSYL